ncbi:MAG: hypothetical protein FJ087_00390 [Deltaproteobacteria bacterium]|nr:hypothetical protein [Deltaproteobacteria bacterium]
MRAHSAVMGAICLLAATVALAQAQAPAGGGAGAGGTAQGGGGQAAAGRPKEDCRPGVAFLPPEAGATVSAWMQAKPALPEGFAIASAGIEATDIVIVLSNGTAEARVRLGPRDRPAAATGRYFSLDATAPAGAAAKPFLDLARAIDAAFTDSPWIACRTNDPVAEEAASAAGPVVPAWAWLAIAALTVAIVAAAVFVVARRRRETPAAGVGSPPAAPEPAPAPELAPEPEPAPAPEPAPGEAAPPAVEPPAAPAADSQAGEPTAPGDAGPEDRPA